MTPDRQGATSACAVVICCFTGRRFPDLRRAVASALEQTAPPTDVVVAVDNNPELLRRVRAELPDVVSVANSGERGAGPSRNVGAAATQSELVAFLDDDAMADRRWLEVLCPHLHDARVVGAGGTVEPAWDEPPPGWFPGEFRWTVGASYRGHPTDCTPVRNVWTGSMVVAREVFDAVGGFRIGFGKVRTRARPEDTDFCMRAARSLESGTWIFDPEAVIYHRVRPDRATVGSFLRRCYDEGAGKAELTDLMGFGDSTSLERDYVRRALPRGVAAGIRDVARGDASGAGRAAAIVGGLASGALGFGVETVRLRARGRPRRGG